MDYAGSIIAGIIAFWAMGLVTWQLKRQALTADRQYDTLLVLIDKEKAAIAASMSVVRTRSNGKTGSDAVRSHQNKLELRKKELASLHDKIHDQGGIIHPDQEAELAKYADIR